MGIFEGVASLAGTGVDLMNFFQQRKVLNYNKQLQQDIFQREDNSVQRRSADMEAAGLSKTLAAGAGAQAGAAVKVESPQMKAENAALAMNMMMQKANIARTAAETDLVKAKVYTERENLKIARATAIMKDIESRIMSGSVITEGGKKVTYEEFKRSQAYYESLIAKTDYAIKKYEGTIATFAERIERGMQDQLRAKYGVGETIPVKEMEKLAAYAKWATKIEIFKRERALAQLQMRDTDLYKGTLWKTTPSNQQAGKYFKEMLSLLAPVMEFMAKAENF